MGSSIVQGELWGAEARAWTQLQEPSSVPLWEAMLTAAGVGTGIRFLDAGCGGGGACVMAAARGAVVSGLDASPALIAIAKARLPVADFRVGDLEALPFADGAFHSVIAANSVQYAADPVAALKELARVCAPRGRVAIGVWASPEQCEMRHVFAAVRAALPSPPPGEGPFALSMPGRLEQVTTQAGFRTISSGEVDCPFEYADIDALWRAQRSAGPLQGAMRAVGEAKIEAAVRGVVRQFVKPDGRVRLENRFRYVVLSK